MRTFRLLAWFTQLGFSVAAPLVLCIWGAVYLQGRFGLGGWVVPAGVLLGAGGAVSGFRNSLAAMRREAESEEKEKDEKKEPPVSFNDHT